ncbi:zinc ABC transporter substrate-binding protein [Actinorhabdospora filicis]|uniref:Zinc ABC transporter substrate-binding protein n=1 Tax=Actinorhabdospora filicis TaxID=1785913 RepID=A0A9W6SND2_9ACTN|nr:metal ABC transporter substrate-binding protein [Actinorhabdospora filicis]GLZ79398.1 zinc ABC transporter substrate-binding protein [Actinorhabdospora filicis]
MRQSPLKVAAVSLLAGSVLALAACGKGAGGGTTPDPNANPDASVEAVAAFYPLQFVTKRVGGAHVNVAGLTAPGVEPHDLELSPRQVADMTGAGLVVYLGGFQPAVDDAVAGMDKAKTFDVATATPLVDHHLPAEGEDADHDHDALDPHVWLDPTRLAAIADQVAAKLGELDPAHAADYTTGAAQLRTELTALDTEFATGLQTCQRKELVTSHAAFGYLADRYGLNQIAITGITPEGEPSPGRIAEVAKYAKEHGVTTIFFETLVNPAVAETLAKEVGAQAKVLDPIEGLAKDSTGDYFSVMRGNLTALKEALGCG